MTLKGLYQITNKVLMTYSKIKLYQNWLPQEKGTPLFINPSDLRTTCALLTGNACGRTPTSNNLEFYQSAVTILLTLDDENLKQFEVNPDALPTWLNTLNEDDGSYISYIEYLVRLIKEKVFSGEYDSLDPLFKDSLQCQDWVSQYRAN